MDRRRRRRPQHRRLLSHGPADARVGIALPGLVQALIAAAMGLLLAGEQAAPVAFIAGVAGPLVGADLFHLRDIEKMATGVLSISGAGTFDGIVLSGIVAAYLA